MEIRAVFFDMGGTIETFGYTPELRLRAVAGIRERLSQAGIDLRLEDERLLETITRGLDQYKRWSIQSLEELPPGVVWSEYIFKEYPVERAKLEPIAEDLSFRVETQFYQRAMRPEMPGVLEAIRQMGLKMGVISNVNSRDQVPENLRAYGIRHYFDPIVLSSEYGRRKPDPAIFHYAARLANVPTSECAYVGDRVVRDIDGARRAGFGLAIQIRHEFEHGENDEGAIPDAIIESMDGLLDILRSEARQARAIPLPGDVRAILFDAGDILYYRPRRGHCFQSFLEALALESSERHAIGKAWLSNQAYRGEIDQDHYQEELLRMYGITEPDLVERGKQALNGDENDVEFFDGVQESLITLKERGYLLGIVTDTANPIHAKLNWFERGGFGHVWDSIISSSELGTRKPDPRIYEAALEQLGVQAAQAVFVGHRAVELRGARDAGMKTIALNYDADAEADYFINKFPELLTVPIIAHKEGHRRVDA